MVKVKFVKGVGMVTEAGTDAVQDLQPSAYTVTARTTNFTVGLLDAINTIDSADSLTGTLPAPSAAAGVRYIFRSLTAVQHCLTTTDAGVNDLVGNASGSLVSAGAVMKLAALVGASAIVESDGAHYIVSAHSGTISFV